MPNSRDEKYRLKIKNKFYGEIFEEFKDDFKRNRIHVKAIEEQEIKKHEDSLYDEVTIIKDKFREDLKNLKDKSKESYLKFKRANYDIPILIANDKLELKCIKTINSIKKEIRIEFREKWLNKLGISAFTDFINMLTHQKQYFEDLFQECKSIEDIWKSTRGIKN